MTTQMQIRKMGFSRREARALLRTAHMYWREAKKMGDREYSNRDRAVTAIDITVTRGVI